MTEEQIENDNKSFLVTKKSLQVGILGFIVGFFSFIYSIIVTISNLAFNNKLDIFITGVLTFIVLLSISIPLYFYLSSESE